MEKFNSNVHCTFVISLFNECAVLLKVISTISMFEVWLLTFILTKCDSGNISDVVVYVRVTVKVI